MIIQTATNPETGEKVALINGQWVPVGQTATNDKGQKAYLVNNQWLTDQPTEQPKDKGFLSNIGSLIYEGGERAIGAAKIAPSVVTGDVGADKAKLLAQELSRPESVRPPELVEAQQAFKDEAAAFEKAKGFRESVGPFADFMLEFGKQALTNPKGAAYLTAQSAANMAPQIAGMIAGGKGGAALGSLGGPGGAAIGAGVGAIGGGFAAGAPLEVGSEFIGRIGDALRERGLEPTEENVAALLRDRKAVEQAIGEARTKGVTTAAVDSLMTVGAGKFASGPRRAAIDAAKKELGATADAAKLAARADDILKTRTLTQKAGRGAGAVGIDVAGGGISEAAGQAAAYGEVNLEDVGQEMLGSLGGAALEVPAAAYATATDALKKPTAEAPTAPPVPPEAPVTTPVAAEPSPTQAIEDQATEFERQQQRQEAAMERARSIGIGGGSEVNQTLLEQARIRGEQQERAAAAEEKAAEDERKKALRAERVRIGSTQYSGDKMINEMLRSRAIAEFDAANAPKVVAPKIPEYQPTKTIEQTTPIEQPEGVNVLRGLDYRDADFRTAMAERRAAEEAAAATQTKQAEAQKVEQAAKTDASRADVDLRVAQVENYLMSPAKKTQQETADYMAGVVPEMQKDFLALLDEDMSQPLTPEQTEALKTQIRQRMQPEVAPDEVAQRTPFKKFLASKGMNKQDVQDIFGENAYRANQQLPGAIRADAPRLDMLAEAAVEAGFLQEEDTEALTQMIKDEFGGDEQVAVDMVDDRAAAEYEAQRENELASRAGAIGLNTKGMTPDQIAARLDRIERKREEKRRQYSREIDGFADLPTVEQDRIIDMMIDQFGEPQVFDVERAEIEGRVRDEEVIGQEPMFAAETGKGYNFSAEDQRIEKDLTGKSMIQAADWAVANAPNAFAKVIAEKTRNRLREFQRKGMTLEFNISGGSSRLRMLSGARGVTQFEWGKDDKGTKITVTLNGAAVMDNQAGYPPGVQYNTILHELLHVATRSQFVFMPNTDPLKKQMIELFNTVVGRFNADVKAGTLPPVMEKYYKRMNNVLEDTDELLAWGLTDKDVQTYLDDIKVGNKSVFTRLIELIRTALGLGKPYESALERLVRTSESLLDVDVDAIDAMLGQRDKQIGVKRKPVGPMKQESLFQKDSAPAAMREQAKAPPTESAAFLKWFGDSKVVDENGKPLVVSHITKKKGITTFDPKYKTELSSMGFHFGTPEQAQFRGTQYDFNSRGEPEVGQYYLSIKKPLRVSHMASYAPDHLADKMADMGILDDDSYADIQSETGYDSVETGDRLVQILKKSGYDGLVYENEKEGTGDSYVPFDPTQIKSATGNIGTYDPENADIRYQRSPAGGKSIGKQQTQSVVDAVKGQWANAPEVVVAENMDDPAIPQEVRDHNKEAMAKGAKGSPRGFFYKGKAYVMADAATSSTQVIETLFHESLGHYGLRGTFGPEMGKVLADVVKNRRADVEAKAKEYGLDVNSQKDMLEAAEEVLAEMAQNKPGLTFVKRAISVIRNFLRDLGLPFKMSNEDIIQKYILPARAFVESGERRKVEGKPAAMREPAKAPPTEDTDIRYQRKTKPTPNQAAQENLAILDATGMQLQPPEPGRIQNIKDTLRKMGEDPAMTKDSAKSAIKKFLDKMEVAAFSGDAAFNNDIRRNLEKDFADNPEVLGMLLDASQSQAVHADALATQFIVDGGIAFDPETKKWVSIKKEDNFIKLAKQIEKAAEKYGLNKEQTEQIAHTYFVAKRFKDLLKKQNARDAETDRLNAELEAENANIKQYKKEGDFEKLRTSERAKNDIKADIAKLEKAKVFISDDQRAMIEPGLSLVKNMPELEEISDTWQGIRANAVKAMIDGNLWSMEYAENMLDNAAYVPFYRDEQLDEGGGPQEFIKGMQVKAAEFRLKGSNAAVNDVFDNMVRWTQYAINRSVRNHKALQMVDLGTEMKVGDRKMAEKVEKMDPKKNTIRVFRDGTQEIYSMADPLYVDAFSAISNVTIPSLKFFTWFSNLLRQSVVLYPLFSVAQVPQDAISAMFTSGLKTRYALRIPALAVKEFVKTLAKTSATHNLLKTYGATGVRDFNATVARQDIQIAAGLKGAKGVGGETVEFLSHVAMAADNSIRQAVYEASMQQGLSKGEAIEKAFDIINFRRRGTSKLVNLFGQTVPFFYAYMSVQRTAYKTLTLVGISPQERKEALNTLATTSGAVMALSLFYVMMNGGDEEYEKTPDAIRDRTLNIPGTGGLRIPLRPDLFLMPKVLTEHLYHLITDDGLSDGAKFRKSVADGVANAVLSPQPIPQAVKPAIEVAINYDFFQGRPLIGQFEKQKEAERQFNDNTSEFSKMLGQFGVSPIAADHVIRGMFGSAGGLFLYTTNFMINSDPDVPRPELSFRDALSSLPGTSGFVTKASENALKTDFYALRDEVEKVKNTYNDIKLRSPQELDQFLADEKNIARLGLAKGTEKIGMQLSKIRRAINQITNAPDDLYSASEKKDAIKELRDVEREMLKSVDIPALRKAAMM